MSALTNGLLRNAAGRIIVSNVAPVASFFRAMGVGALGELKITPFPSAGPFFFNGTVNVDATGAVLTDTATAISNYVGGIPLTVNGALATELAAPATFVGGVGITATGRVAVI